MKRSKNGSMIDKKEILILLINHKGQCLGENVDCDYCLASPIKYRNTHGCSDIATIYKNALKIYLRKYGKENLVEVLI